MSKEIKLVGSISVVPLPPPADDPKANNKTLVIQVPDAGEIYLYEMTEDLTQKLARFFRMNNAALEDHIRQEMERIRVQQLAGPIANGGAPDPEAERKIQQFLRGGGRG